MSSAASVKGWKARIKSRTLMELLLPTVDPETAAQWEARMREWDRADREAEKRRRRKEVAYSVVGITDADGRDGKPTAKVQPRKRGVGAAQLAFHLSVPASLSARRRGVPGNTAGRAGVRE